MDLKEEQQTKCYQMQSIRHGLNILIILIGIGIIMLCVMLHVANDTDYNHSKGKKTMLITETTQPPTTVPTIIATIKHKAAKPAKKVNITCKLTMVGRNYKGYINITKNGQLCQHWAAQFPHRHLYYIKHFPDISLKAAANYCRNPDSMPQGPWCYTMNFLVRWRYCDVRLC